EAPGLAKCPAVLEYLPYRKDDITAVRDHRRHVWTAFARIAVARADLRGCGDSDGHCSDEYFASGAARRPPVDRLAGRPVLDKWPNWALRQELGRIQRPAAGRDGLSGLAAVVSIYSSDDRFNSDIHYTGGCVIGTEALTWSSFMLAINSLPPARQFGQPVTRAWRDRLNWDGHRPWIDRWLRHQTPDDYWRRGSVRFGLNQLTVPVLLIGGWHDLYSDALLRLADRLPNTASCALLGPWNATVWRGRWLAADSYRELLAPAGRAAQFRLTGGQQLESGSASPGPTAGLSICRLGSNAVSPIRSFCRLAIKTTRLIRAISNRMATVWRVDSLGEDLDLFGSAEASLNLQLVQANPSANPTASPLSDSRRDSLKNRLVFSAAEVIVPAFEPAPMVSPDWARSACGVEDSSCGPSILARPRRKLREVETATERNCATSTVANLLLRPRAKSPEKRFQQTWTDNMGKAGEAKIMKNAAEDYTKPDLTKFGMTELDDDTIALFSRRAFDIAGTCSGVRVFLNGEKLPVTSFKDYYRLYLTEKEDKEVAIIKSGRWELAVCLSNDGFKQVSFVNSIATTKGGRHVDFVCDLLLKRLVDAIDGKCKADKKNLKGSIKPAFVKNHLWIFCNCLIENPSFDSQTKEFMTLQAKKFGSAPELDDKFFKKLLSEDCGIVRCVLEYADFKTNKALNQRTKASKKTFHEKLDHANNAGKGECVLILTEGDSAKSLAVAAPCRDGRDRFGVFPLKGKLLNVREASKDQLMNNKEIKVIQDAVNLQYGKKYNTVEDLKSLRYRHIMIMTDQDQDGSHIKGLIINFIHFFWPELLRHDFL
uniref:DNA topoisomerase 2 n=1 Tax=Macrostomum lignano TaxID=282301 RepID=A0A1I8FTX2_9PLAT